MAMELRVPAERLAPPKDLELRPKQAKAWVESLPLSQSADAGHKILANVTTINRARVDFDVRLQLLEAYRPVAGVVLDELEAVYGKSALPLPPRPREALALARSLATEFAYGYKILLLEKTGKLIAFGAKKQLPMLMHRAIEYLVAQLGTSYRSYTPVAPGVWREIHQIYVQAEKDGIAQEPADPETRSSILDLFAETLLVALADPYRLTPGEIDRIVDIIRGNRGLATLGQSRPPTNPGGHFLVPCDTDRPPKPLLSANDDAGGPNWRLLDANALVDKLRGRRSAVETGNVSATTSRAMSPEMLALFTKLIALWGDPPKRSSRRNPMEANVAICAGLPAVAHFVSMGPQVGVKQEAEAIRKGITIPLISIPDDEVSKGMQVNEWEVVNLSAGGLKVRRTGAPGQSIVVGEVVGIKSLGKAHWSVGVVRWLTMLEVGGMEFGIQFIAPAARCVAVQPTMGTASSQVKLGLLIAGEEGFDAGDSLMTPPGTFSDLREFEVEEQGLVKLVRATSLIEKTTRFELFHISPS
jgi:hypothetical protein